jgi:hypothetical protein
MKVDKRVVEPFNAWWRERNHCEPSLPAIEAFAAGFQAGLLRGVLEAKAILEGSPPSDETAANRSAEHGKG